jgi:hypothetical protein
MTPSNPTCPRDKHLFQTLSAWYRVKRNSRTSSPQCDSLLENKSKIRYNKCPETHSFRDARCRQMGWHISAALSVRTKSALLGALETQSRQRGSVVIERSWDTQTTIAATRPWPPVEIGTAALDYLVCHPGRRRQDADVFRRLQQRLRETQV